MAIEHRKLTYSECIELIKSTPNDLSVSNPQQRQPTEKKNLLREIKSKYQILIKDYRWHVSETKRISAEKKEMRQIIAKLRGETNENTE